MQGLPFSLWATLYNNWLEERTEDNCFDALNALIELWPYIVSFSAYFMIKLNERSLTTGLYTSPLLCVCVCKRVCS